MAISVTYHGGLGRDWAQAVAGQLGDGFAVSDDAVSSALTRAGLYRIVATSDCTVRMGAGLTDATNGEHWITGEKEVRYLSAGDVIAVDAP